LPWADQACIAASGVVSSIQVSKLGYLAVMCNNDVMIDVICGNIYRIVIRGIPVYWTHYFKLLHFQFLVLMDVICSNDVNFLVLAGVLGLPWKIFSV
jgi:hypothetical protein